MKMRIAVPLALAGAVLVFGVGATGLSLPHAQSAAAISNCDTNEADLNAAELEMLAGINAERANVGAAALVPSPALNRAAAWKSADSSATGPGLSHTDSLGRAWDQ